MDEQLIYIIDDDPVFRLIVKKQIEKTGRPFRAEFYENGHDGLIALKNGIATNNSPAIILLDIEMPKMDGWQFMENLKEFPPGHSESINIYIVTSSISQADRDKAKTYPLIKKYITKPLSAEVLDEILN